MRCAMVLGMLGLAAAQAAPLPALKAGQDISVSGVSSGGYMAVQMQVAHAQQVSGAGIFAAGPYDCAQGSMLRALTHCMAGSRLFPPPIPADTRALIENRARAVDTVRRCLEGLPPGHARFEQLECLEGLVDGFDHGY